MKISIALATVEQLANDRLSIVKFRENTVDWDESNLNETTVLFDTKDLSSLHHEWLNWIEYHDYSEYDCWDEYLEAFLESLGMPYWYIVPDKLFEL